MVYELLVIFGRGWWVTRYANPPYGVYGFCGVLLLAEAFFGAVLFGDAEGFSFFAIL